MAGANEMQFSSMPRDSLSGLSLYPFRAYEPNFQRWINQDPIQKFGGLNLYAFVQNDSLNEIDPFGLDVWVEGPSGSEPTGHQSINVGDPFGDYSSYSFGADGNFNLGYGIEGSVYEDDETGGAIEAYKKTTALEDRRLKSQLDTMVDHNKGAYGLGNTCRSWSQDQFKKAPGKISPPPPRTPASRSFWRKTTSSSKPTSTTTSSSGTSTSR
jgi:RHS repeat-associated protein